MLLILSVLLLLFIDLVFVLLLLCFSRYMKKKKLFLIICKFIFLFLFLLNKLLALVDTWKKQFIALYWFGLRPPLSQTCITLVGPFTFVAEFPTRILCCYAKNLVVTSLGMSLAECFTLCLQQVQNNIFIKSCLRVEDIICWILKNSMSFA